MPLDIKNLDSETIDILGEQTNAKRILEFLTTNSDYAYTHAQIANATGIVANSVGLALSRLHDQELVRHQGNYWTIADDIDYREID